MLREGIYGLDYYLATEKPETIGSGLAMLRGGKILATDRCGGIFMGSYDYDKAHTRNRVALRLQLPAGELVTGMTLGDGGADFDVEAELSGGDTIETTIELAGQPVMIKLTFIGPPPI